MPSHTTGSVVECPTDSRTSGAVAIKVKNVCKTYSRRRWLGLRSSSAEVKHALRNVSFEIPEGGMVGLLGPNGAGKTTLLKSIATLLSVSSGAILVQGVDVEAHPIQARALIGLVTCDERSFYWRLTGRQNLEFFAALYRVPEKTATQRIERLFEMLRLSDVADTPYHSYSTGMRQRMAIARGLLAEPRVILYDEPTRSLDPLNAQSIREWILANRLTSPTTTHVIATNQLREAEQLCDRVLILNRGTIVADGTIAQIREKFQEGSHVTSRITYRGAPDLRLRPRPEAGLYQVGAPEPAEDGETLRIVSGQNGEGLSAVLSEILGRGGAVLRCQTEEAAFDEVFCSIVLGDHATAGGKQ